MTTNPFLTNQQPEQTYEQVDETTLLNAVEPPPEPSLLDTMNDYFDNTGQQQAQQTGSTVIRPTSTDNSANLTLFYQKLEDMGMNLDELKPILECPTHLLVLSGAGAGKTTMLILKIIRDLISGDAMKVVTTNSVYGVTHVQVPARILIATFLRSGAQDLQQSFREWCQKLNLVGIDYTNIVFKTIHAEVKEALNQMGVDTPILEDSYSIMRSVMNKYSIRSNTATSPSLTQDEMRDMEGIVSYARNRLDEKRYTQALMDDYRMNHVLLDAVLQDLKIFRSATGRMDFEDMQEMLLEALQMNANVAKFIGERYDYVYVDEFQDTSQLQYEILLYYFTQVKRAVAVGDTEQTIYSFRGSDSNIIKHRFIEDLKPTVMELTTNYRCKANILNSVKPSIELNGNDHTKNIKSYKEGGEVNVVMNADINHLVTSMKEDLVNNMNVGVLARVNADLLIPAIILELDGGVNFGLSKSVNMTGRMARQVFGVIDLITKRLTEEFESHFRMFLPRHAWHEAKKLSNILKNNRNLNIYTIPFEDYKSSTPTLAPFLKGLQNANNIGGVEAYIYILGVMEQQAFTGKSLYAQKARELVKFVRKIVQEHESIKDLDISSIDSLFNQVLPERLGRRIKYASDTHVKLSTVHEAKGKEWDSVYIWNNVEGAFPNIVGNREMTQEEFEEERRVHYIAWTRAKTKLTVYTDKYNQGSFLKECDLSQVIPEDNEKPETTRVFKKAQPQQDSPDTEVYLRRYITDSFSNGGITDEKVANITIVQEKYTQEELVQLLNEKYGLDMEKDPETSYELIELFFRELSDEIYNGGNYHA